MSDIYFKLIEVIEQSLLNLFSEDLEKLEFTSESCSRRPYIGGTFSRQMIRERGGKREKQFIGWLAP